MTFGPFFTGEPEATPAKPVRARAEKGKFQADDPSTPDVNEAWVNPKTGEPKRRTKKAKE
jgi:hypothetical protein